MSDGTLCLLAARIISTQSFALVLHGILTIDTCEGLSKEHGALETIVRLQLLQLYMQFTVRIT